jgi:hypothetical protein
MTPQHCFGVVIRTVGLLLLVGSLYFLFSAVYLLAVPLQRPHSPPSTYALYGCAIGALSLYLLRGAPLLMRFCYPS